MKKGYSDTIPVTLDDIIHHTKAVKRSNTKALVVADMPFGTYVIISTNSKGDINSAYTNCVKVFRESGADAVKLEGGTDIIPIMDNLIKKGIAVMGHIGLTPQSASVLGGFRGQGKTLESSMKILEDAIALERIGCFSIVAECIPSLLSEKISDLINIPLIGIGAGNKCDGQVLVYHDILNIIPNYKRPSFSKEFGNISELSINSLTKYNDEVKNRQFPEEKHSKIIVKLTFKYIDG